MKSRWDLTFRIYVRRVKWKGAIRLNVPNITSITTLGRISLGFLRLPFFIYTDKCSVSFFFFALETAKISHPQLSWQFPSGYRTRAWHPLVEREKKSKAGHLPYLVTEFKLWLYHHCSDEGLSFSRNKLPLESNLNQCLWKTYNPGYWWCCYRTLFFACGSRIVPLKLASDNS